MRLEDFLKDYLNNNNDRVTALPYKKMLMTSFINATDKEKEEFLINNSAELINNDIDIGNMLNNLNEISLNKVLEIVPIYIKYIGMPDIIYEKANYEYKLKYIESMLDSNEAIFSLEYKLEQLKSDDLKSLLKHKNALSNDDFLTEILMNIDINDLNELFLTYEKFLDTNHLIKIIERFPEEIKESYYKEVINNRSISINNIKTNDLTFMVGYIKSINSQEEKYNLILEIIPKLIEYHQLADFVYDLVKSIDENKEKIKKIINLYSKEIGASDPYALKSFISLLDKEDKLYYIEKYKDILKFDYENPIERKINFNSLIDIFDDETKFEFCKKYSHLLASDNVLYIARYMKESIKMDFLDYFIEKVNPNDLFAEICKQKDNTTKKELLQRYYYKLDNNLAKKYDIFKEENPELYNKIFDDYVQIDKRMLRNIIIYHKKNPELFDSLEKIEKSINIINRILESNSSEMRRISGELCLMIFHSQFDEWDDLTEKIESIFLKNNIPYVGKVFKVFEVMHPDGIVENKMYKTISPNLNARSNPISRKIIIFSDLLKCSLGSNNRSINEYINNLLVGDSILGDLIAGKKTIEDLDDFERDNYTIFVNHLNTLYNNTEAGKKHPRKLKNNLIKDSYELLSLFLKNEKEDFKVGELPDRIVRMFGHFAGINSVNELINYRDKTIMAANQKNIDRANRNFFTLNVGDYYKGLVNEEANEKDFYYSFLIDILQNGSVCKEFLGSDARSDTTPLDTDLSRLITNFNSFEIPFVDPNYAAARYGPLWLVLKDDDRFNYSEETKTYDPSKLELFETSRDGMGHYGIRTGFPSSDIDYFVVDESRVKMHRIENAIAMNGFYIPVLNTKGQLVFTPEKYNEIRERMQGLSHYGVYDYSFADELDNFDINKENYNISLDLDNDEVSRKRNIIVNTLSSAGLNIITKRQNNADNGIFELLDTGSTGRGTNCAQDYDFDFILRVDREVYNKKQDELRKTISEAFPGIQFESNTRIRNQIVNVNNDKIKIDITIIPKDDKIEYTTDECVKDRLNTIKRIDEDKYKKVLENIVLAKEVLKENNVYKSKNSEVNAEGGLGGVGIENWILQNGGSFERAAKNFLEAAEKYGSFENFKKNYIIYDFGENHMYLRHNDRYKHDEFINNNMNEYGYNRMVETLKQYLENKKKEEKHI